MAEAAAVLEQTAAAKWLDSGSPLAGQPVAAAQARWDLGSLPEEEKMGEGAKLKRVLANATLGRKSSPPHAPPAEAGSEARRRQSVNQ
jgi:hypothetical protein